MKNNKDWLLRDKDDTGTIYADYWQWKDKVNNIILNETGFKKIKALKFSQETILFESYKEGYSHWDMADMLLKDIKECI